VLVLRRQESQPGLLGLRLVVGLRLVGDPPGFEIERLPAQP
jgi:hypothetical protein